MILQATNNKNMAEIVGKDFSFRKNTDGSTTFFVKGGTQSFTSFVKEPIFSGNTYTVKTTHSTYVFELLPGEQIGAYGILNSRINPLWEKEHS